MFSVTFFVVVVVVVLLAAVFFLFVCSLASFPPVLVDVHLPIRVSAPLFFGCTCLCSIKSSQITDIQTDHHLNYQ